MTTHMVINTPVADDTPAATKVGGSIDLLNEILTRVPARDLFRFKCVSRYWCHLISDDRNFADIQTKRNPKGTCSGLISFSSASPASSSTAMKVKKFDFFWISDRLRFNPPPPALSFLESMSCSRILQSCNGLLLCSSSRSDCAYFVCNPVLGQFCRLDLPEEAGGKGDWEFLGLTLVFDPSRWDGFKVICFMSRAIDLYSSAEGKWKRLIQEVGVQESNLAFEDGAYWNGIAIWLRKDSPAALGNDPSIYCVLNLEKEEFDEDGYPLPCAYSMVCHFGESMDHLHLVTKDREAFYMYEMGGNLEWVLKFRVVESVMRTRLNTGHSPISNFVWDGSWVLGVVRSKKEQKKEEDGFLVVWYLPSGAGRVVAYNCKTSLVSCLSESMIPGKTRQFIESLHWV